MGSRTTDDVVLMSVRLLEGLGLLTSLLVKAWMLLDVYHAVLVMADLVS